MGVCVGGILGRRFTAFAAVTSMTIATVSGWTADLGLEDARLREAPMSAETTLPRPASQDRVEVARLLLDGGADVNAADQSGRTALMHAAITGNEGLAAILVRRGADVNLSDRGGATALMLAVEKNSVEIVRLILSKGANVNAKDRMGETALMRACRTGAPEMARLLLKKGADVNAVNRTGRTALDVTSDERVKHILKEQGANQTRQQQTDTPVERTLGGLPGICGTVDKMIAAIAQIQSAYARSAHPGDPVNMESDPAMKQSARRLHKALNDYALRSPKDPQQAAQARKVNRLLKDWFAARIALTVERDQGLESPVTREKAAVLCDQALTSIRKLCPSVSPDLCAHP